MKRRFAFSSYDVGYGNYVLEIKDLDFRVEVSFGLIDIHKYHELIYRKVVRIDGLSKTEIMQKVKPIIEEKLREHGIDIEIVIGAGKREKVY